MTQSRAWCLLAVVVAVVWSGCSGPLPAPERAELVPADVARRALEEFDANHDGKIDAQELKKSPALLASLKDLDANRDGGVTADEIATRVQKWVETPVARINANTTVLLDDKPLAGATIVFEPEKCMGPEYTPLTAKTNESGQCYPSIDDPNSSGLYPGFYRLRITHPSVSIPPRYNAQTELGMELSDSSSNRRTRGTVRLTSK